MGCGGTRARPEALDFAVTSGVRSDVVWQSGQEPEQLFDQYEQTKFTYKDTKNLCEAQGLEFTPLVFEAHGGGWSTKTRRVLDFLAKQQSSAGDYCKEGTGLRLAQRLSTSLHRENARAILKRVGGLQRDSTPVITDLTAWGADTDSV